MSCPDCFKGSIHDHATPQGAEENLNGYRTYVAKGQPNNPSTIIFITDAFGLELVNNKILADRYAKDTGCRVLMPDIIPGGPAPVSAITTMGTLLQAEGWNWLNPLTWVYKVWAFGGTLVAMVPFALRSSPPKAFPLCLAYARDVKAGMPAGGKLGVAGFCWGGYQSTKLSAEPAVAGGTTPLIDAQFNAHPSALKHPDDIVAAVAAFHTPYSCAVAEVDFQFNDKLAMDTEAAVRQKLGEGVGHYEFKVHKGCTHGFAVRASIPEGADGYEAAAVQAADWFNRFLN